MTKLSVSERVDRGIRRLDKRGPANWRDQINVNYLDVDSFFDCPVGQVYGSFGAGMEALGLRVAETFRFGFDVYPSTPDLLEGEEFQALTAEWKRRLSE